MFVEARIAAFPAQVFDRDQSIFVIPGRSEGPDPESRATRRGVVLGSGFRAHAVGVSRNDGSGFQRPQVDKPAQSGEQQGADMQLQREFAR